MWLLSEGDEFRGAFETEVLAEQAAWEVSEQDGFWKEQTIAYMEDNTAVHHIKDVFEWTCARLLSDKPYELDETERFALENFKDKRQAKESRALGALGL